RGATGNRGLYGPVERKNRMTISNQHHSVPRRPSSQRRCVQILLLTILLLPYGTNEAAELTRDAVVAALADASPDLSDRDLSGLDLSGLDFKAGKLQGTDLRGAT